MAGIEEQSLFKVCRISREYRYDAENQLISVSYESGLIVQYTYDNAGNRIFAAVVPGEAELQQTPSAGAGSPIPGSIFCPHCNTLVTPGKKFCKNCGAGVNPPSHLPQEQRNVCPKCGQLLKAGAQFCNSCGEKIS